MRAAGRSRLYSKVSAWADVFARSYVIGVIRVRNCLRGVSSASKIVMFDSNI